MTGLGDARRALLAKRLAGARPPATIVPRQRDAAPVLSAGQRRFWLLHQIDPAMVAAYNVPRVLRLRGPLDVAALAAALTALVERHEVLRTAVSDLGGRPVPVLLAPREVALPVVDVTAVPGETLDGTALRLAAEEVARPFSLDGEPLLRGLLLRLANDDHLLVLTTHHVAADEGSRLVLLDELARLYAIRRRGGRTDVLAAPTLQYADYAAWEQSAEQSAALQGHLDYWYDALAGAPDVVDLPSDRPRPASRDHRGARLGRDLDHAVSQAVVELARTTGTTTFMVLLAGFAALLHRLTGQDEIVVGVPVSGRRYPELQDVIGCFANTLALPVNVDGEASFADLLAHVRDVTAGGLQHQDAPFEQVVERLRPPRDPSRTPLFQVCFNHVGVTGPTPQLDGVHVESIEVDPGLAKFDLTLVTREQEDGLRLLWEFATDMLDAETVEGWHRQLVRLLDAAVRRPDTAVAALPLLDDAAIAALRAAVPAADPEVRPVTVLDLVDEWVARTPDAVAVRDEATALTYTELAAASDEFAARLVGLGVTAGSLVAVCLERSATMVAVLLGVLKAGAAYVPLDPAFPPDRLTFMLRDSHVGVAVTQGSLRELVEGDDRRLLLVDDLPYDAPRVAPVERPEGGDLAYAIYTSGSTGLPKGVLIEHWALSNFLQSVAREPGCAAGDVLVAVTTLSFDIAGLELFLPLVTGATTVVLSRDTATDPQLLAAAIDRFAATVVQATPSTWRMLVDTGWAGRPGLRMLCGGEALPPTLAIALLPLGAELWNMYGPTETTIWSTVDRVVPGRPIRLGRPLANTDLLVVDRRMQPVPTGVAGELLIGGAGLARGYHERPELTAERFVAHPLVAGARAYRTGDLVRSRRDGTLEFLGRIDHQVKVRGFRIELGEVETAIAVHPDVRDVVVVVREDEPGDRRLVGYVVGEVDVAGLRSFLGSRLPGYMVPSVLMGLDALPRTPNGKTDRKALPVPIAESATGAEYVPPQGPVEEAVAAMWCDVLKLDRVGRDEDFFTLGGHSLRITQVLARVRDAFGVSLPLHEVYQHPTVAAIADAITLHLLDDPELAELIADLEEPEGLDA